MCVLNIYIYIMTFNTYIYMYLYNIWDYIQYLVINHNRKYFNIYSFPLWFITRY